MNRLIVTNGESGVYVIKQSGFQGTIFSWDDVLHDGPVTGGYPLQVISELRAKYIASAFDLSFEDVYPKFLARDQNLLNAHQYDELVLCFEHDLYDQLQVIQILGLFVEEVPRPAKISLALLPKHLTSYSPEELLSHLENREEATDATLMEARSAWDAFTDESPEQLETVFSREYNQLLHLGAAMERLAEEYHNYKSGLSLTEQYILDCLSEGPQKGAKLFGAYQKKEEAAFMGDGSFMQRLQGLSSGKVPLVKMQAVNGYANGDGEMPPEWHYTYEITPAGKTVLAGVGTRSDYIDVDYWLGGTHINLSNYWRWNPDERRFVR